jgi:hypothetical protein
MNANTKAMEVWYFELYELNGVVSELHLVSMISRCVNSVPMAVSESSVAVSSVRLNVSPLEILS